MITLPFTREGASVIISREITEEEQAVIDRHTYKLTTATHVIYYDGDEPEELRAPKFSEPQPQPDPLSLYTVDQLYKELQNRLK